MIVQSQIQEGLSMPFKILKKKSSFFIACGLIFTFIIGIAAGYFSAHGITENGKFEAFTQEVFRNEVSLAVLLLFIIPWLIRKSRESGEKQLLLARFLQI